MSYLAIEEVKVEPPALADEVRMIWGRNSSSAVTFRLAPNGKDDIPRGAMPEWL
jgi:hypothetical protein